MPVHSDGSGGGGGFNMLKEIVRGIGFWQCAVEEGERDGLVQDPSLKCLKSIHIEPSGQQMERGVGQRT